MISNQEKAKTKIIEKTGLKSKLILKSTIPVQKTELMCARFSFQDSLLAAGYSDGRVRLFNMNTDSKINTIDTNPSNKQLTPVSCLRWRPANQQFGGINSVLLVANSNGNLFQFSAKSGKQTFHCQEEDNFILAIDYASNGKSFSTGGKDNVIKVYDEEKKEIITKLSGMKWHSKGHNNRIFSLKFKPDDVNIIASGGWDQNVNIWDIRESKCISTVCGPKISGDSVDFQEHYILTGANRGTDQLQLWDWRTQKMVKQFIWDSQSNVYLSLQQNTNAFLFSAQFCHNNKENILACGGSQMKMFNIQGNQLFQIRCDQNVSVYTCDSGYNSNKYMTGGNSGTLYYLASVKSYE